MTNILLEPPNHREIIQKQTVLSTDSWVSVGDGIDGAADLDKKNIFSRKEF
jgi:hypothetical protein